MPSTKKSTSRRALLLSGTGAVAATITAPAIAQPLPQRRWRCVTSWSKNLPGPGVSAERLAQRISEMSDRELVVEVFPAGTIVPALSVLDAVSTGTVEMGHTAALFWAGKMPAAPLFTTVPFGLDPLAHAAWLMGGGQQLWDELYATQNVKPFVGGNTGPSAAGWFRRPVNSLIDLKGLRIRSTGLGGEVYSALGATASVIPPADTYAALERGVIDAVELLAPMNDAPLGFSRIAKHCLVPGFNKPNGASEFLIRLDLWQALPTHLKAIIVNACHAEHEAGLADAELQNGRALREIMREGVRVEAVPKDILEAAQPAARAVIDRIAAADSRSARIVASYRDALANIGGWSGLADVGRYVPRR